DLDAALAREKAHIEGAEEVEAEDDHKHAADAADPSPIDEQQSANGGRRRAEGEKDQREPDDEQQRVDERRLSRMLNVLEAQSGDERDVARNERQHARRE